MVDEQYVKKTIKTNLNKLWKCLKKDGYTQDYLANITGKSAGSISNYLSMNDDQKDKCPDIFDLIKIMDSDAVKNNYSFRMDEFILDGDLSFEKGHQGDRPLIPTESEQDPEYCGVYKGYFLDQTMKSSEEEEEEEKEAMRIGIFLVYREGDSPSLKVVARFFAKNLEADNLYAAAHDKFHQVMKRGDLENLLGDFMTGTADDESYWGEMEVKEDSIFINVASDYYKDKVQIVLLTPSKKTGTEYVGGLGTMSSVTHGTKKLPVIQAIIISRRPLLNVSDVRIMEKLMIITGNRYELEKEAERIISFFKKLYDPSTQIVWLTDNDKKALVENRLNHLMTNYANKTVGNCTLITEELDKQVYELLKDKKQFPMKKGENERDETNG